jgi:UDP-glucuronate decarboxylase
MRILITGITGFFGKSLLRHIDLLNSSSNKKIEVIGLSRNPEIFFSDYPDFKTKNWLSIQQCDILDLDQLNKNFPDGITDIIHLAVDSTMGPKIKNLQRFEQIYFGAKNILDISIKFNIKNILLASSGGIYGQARNINFIESMPSTLDLYAEKSTYSISKCLVEHIAHLYANEFDLNIKIARCFSFVGQDLPLNAHYAIGNFIRDALFSKFIEVQGNGSAIRSFMHQEDLANWLFCILINGKPGSLYNVGSDFEISIKDLAFKIKELLSKEKQVVFNNLVHVKSNRYVPDISKANCELGLKISYNLDEAITKSASEILKSRRISL